MRVSLFFKSASVAGCVVKLLDFCLFVGWKIVSQWFLICISLMCNTENVCVFKMHLCLFFCKISVHLLPFFYQGVDLLFFFRKSLYIRYYMSHINYKYFFHSFSFDFILRLRYVLYYFWPYNSFSFWDIENYQYFTLLHLVLTITRKNFPTLQLQNWPIIYLSTCMIQIFILKYLISLKFILETDSNSFFLMTT